MSSDFFDASLYAVADGTRVRAGQVNTPIQAIDAGFAKMPSESNMKTGKISYCVDTGAINAMIVELPYVITAYEDGLHVIAKAAFANTITTPVINVNGLGNVVIRRQDGSAVIAGDIPQNHIVEMRYNATTVCFNLMGSIGAQGGAGTMSSQNASAVDITGGELSNVIIYDADKDSYIDFRSDDIIEIRCSGVLLGYFTQDGILLDSSKYIVAQDIRNSSGQQLVSVADNLVRIYTSGAERVRVNSSGLDIRYGQLLVDEMPIIGTFVNSGSGGPYVTSTLLTPTSSITEAAWTSVGPTGSGASVIWTPLDNVQSDADWIEITCEIILYKNNDPAASASCSLSGRAHGSTISYTDCYLGRATCYGSASSPGGSSCYVTRKIPVDSSRRFNLYWLSGGTSEFIYCYLTGFGYNNRSAL